MATLFREFTRDGNVTGATWIMFAIVCMGAGSVHSAPSPGPDELTETSAVDWGADADGATASVYDDGVRVVVGSVSLRFETDGGFDTWLWAPVARDANWDLSATSTLVFQVFAENPSPYGFQGANPWIRIATTPGDYFDYRPDVDLLNDARGAWRGIEVPLPGNATWTRTAVGAPDLADVSAIEIHADTWDAGFTLWLDGLTFRADLLGPTNLQAVALNHAVDLRWDPAVGPTGSFDHYALYRSTAPFASVDGMTPIVTLAGIGSTSYSDAAAQNGIRYYYAVTAVSPNGNETTDIQTVGPRTPRDETDLQVLSIARTPRYPRYDPIYTNYDRREPSGFGPYVFSAATGLGGGQTASTQRWPEVGDPVTYTATVRNRGTNPWSGTLSGTWRVDGQVVGTPSRTVTLDPGEVATFAQALTWDGQSHPVAFSIDGPDARPDNNDGDIDTKSVAFASYVDVSCAEAFRENTSQYPGAVTDDFFDWLNRHMARFNAMFQAAGSTQRVHFDVLEPLADDAPDPPLDRILFAIFPFRYHHGDGDLREGSAYYRPQDDIDFGLLHEMGHQLGLIDLYRLDLPAENNEASGVPYTTIPGLMHGVSDFVSEHSALAMNHWQDTAHGYFGQYLYAIPAEIRMRFLDVDGAPLVGATVRMYQKTERTGLGEVLTDQVKAEGLTDAQGEFILPNVPVNPAIVPPTPAGDALPDNPFGYLAVVGTNGLLHFRVAYEGRIDYAWLDITEVNVAYWHGQTTTALFERPLNLGGVLQVRPPAELTELNASDWVAWGQDSSPGGTYVEDDGARTVSGAAAIRFVTDGGFDTLVRYPGRFLAQWDLTQASTLHISFYAENPNLGFQNGSPWIRLLGEDGNYFEYQYFRDGSPNDLLNEVRGQWRSYEIPLAAPPDTLTGWRRTVVGTPDLAAIRGVEIHSDTWGAGFSLWIDGMRFDLPPDAAVPALTAPGLGGLALMCVLSAFVLIRRSRRGPRRA